MHSLRVRMTILMILAILICVGTIGLISISSIRRAADESSIQLMNLLCDSKYREMNDYMDGIRQAVDIMAHYLADDINSVILVESGVIGAAGTGNSLGERDYSSDQQKLLDDYLHRHIESARLVFRSVSFNTNNAITYFYRINPELSRVEPGFLFSKDGHSDFVEVTPTDILAFSPDEETRVGWYYKTLERGRPSWLSPYSDDNLGLDLLSYIAPIYKAGTFIGVVGMDISYNTLVGQIRDMEIYQTGYAYLTDEFGKIIYHPTLPNGTLLGEVNRDLNTEAAQLYRNPGSNNTLITYEFNGVQKKAAWQTLENGLRLIVTAPVDEIYAGWQQLIQIILFTAILLLVIFVIVVTIVMVRITRPLRTLTEASRQIADGNYDVKLPEVGEDEVGILTSSFRYLVEKLKIYIDDLNSKAYKDPLTGVKNKTAYDIYTRQIDEKLKDHNDEMVFEEFAVLMFDCNMLKEINDQYGHTRGDVYLKTSSNMICKTFVHSPVFRIGGDEFVVILENEEYKNRNELMKSFQKNIEENNAAAGHPWEKVSMAVGIAVYNPRADVSVENVYKRADKAMYKNKREWKEANEKQQ